MGAEEFMKNTVCYRGFLKSCNYSCSYCPFSKHKSSSMELKKDEESLARFVGHISDINKECDDQKYRISGVMITPYGEASIHPYYWEALAKLSVLQGMEKVGLQTNLSFDIDKMLAIYDQAGGDKTKLSVWATYHPEQVKESIFLLQCDKLLSWGVSFCVGAVGNPEKITELQSFYNKLPANVYFWINQMDGLKRNYTMEEVCDFCEMDPFFEEELKGHESDPSMCENRLFVEADGTMKSCNISRPKALNWYDAAPWQMFEDHCTKRQCSCYLAYGGRRDFHKAFGELSIFRVPKMFDAMFLDLDGTLIPEGKRDGLSDITRAKLKGLTRRMPIFLITSYPLEYVKQILKEDIYLFKGISCASGGLNLLLDQSGQKITDIKIIPLQNLPISKIRSFAKKYHAHVSIYHYNKEIYKITIHGRKGFVWNETAVHEIKAFLPCGSRCFVEKHCLEIVSFEARKESAVQYFCKLLGLDVTRIYALGNDEEDKEMMKIMDSKNINQGENENVSYHR